MKKIQSVITMLVVVLMFLSCIRIDNTGSIFGHTAASFTTDMTSDEIESETLAVNRGCSHIEQQDYLNASNVTSISSSFLRRSQSFFRNHERHELLEVVLDVISKVVMSAMVMLLVAAGGAGLSMPYRCLLYYIQDMDGKKRIA